MTDHPPTERHADFINIAHEDIRTATMNSKAGTMPASAAGQDWVTGGLYWSPIEPDMAGLGATSAHLASACDGCPKIRSHHALLPTLGVSDSLNNTLKRQTDNLRCTDYWVWTCRWNGCQDP
jgi:hypothetical protein